MKAHTAIVYAFVYLGILASVVFKLGVTTAATSSITATVDGNVRDGLEAPKDGNPDQVIDGSVVQALDVPQFEDRGIIRASYFKPLEASTACKFDINCLCL